MSRPTPSMHTHRVSSFPRVNAQLAVRAAVLLAVVALFSTYYSRQTGFSSLIQFSHDGHGRELAVVQHIPHYDHKGKAAYDGQVYAQLAIVPLLRDRAIDDVMDIPAYRARRILASWTAYLVGLGDPARVLWIYAAQNLVVLVVLGLLLCRTFPRSDWRSTAAWAACVVTPGLMTAVRFALPDALGATLTVGAVLAVQSRRVWLGACLIGLAALSRETFLLALPILWTDPDRRVGRSIAATALAIAPLLLWQDYVYSIYRSGAMTSGGQLGNPASRYWRDVWVISGEVMRKPWAATRGEITIAVSMVVQLIFVLTRLEWRSAWWWVGSATGALMLPVPPAVWIASPRVFLPLVFAYNVLLPRDSRWFWPLFIVGNVFILATIDLLVVPWWHGWRS